MSTTDLAWIVVGADDLREHGGVLDEALVNARWYLDGTPKAATRWVDTRWAIAAYEKTRDLVGRAALAATDEHQVRDARGELIDARFSIELVRKDIAVTFEAGGGTRNSPEAQNSDYRAGLELVLDRIRRAGLKIANIELASTSAAAAKLSTGGAPGALAGAGLSDAGGGCGELAEGAGRGDRADGAPARGEGRGESGEAGAHRARGSGVQRWCRGRVACWGRFVSVSRSSATRS